MKGTSESVGHIQPAGASTAIEVGDRFEDRWQPEQALGDLAGYLPPDADPTYLEVLVELACRDLERRLQVGQPARAEQYLERFPALGRDAAAAIEVVITEFQQRRSREGNLTTEEYRQRFPQFAAALNAHLQTAGPVIPGYQILGELGRGGMGVVYKARHLRLNRVVALKVILAGQHVGAEALARFRAEAEAAAALQHPHIVQIFEIGEHEGLPFLVLEYVAGGTLAEKLQGQPHEPRYAAALVETLARALHHAHQAGIIHRDLKPGNVLLAGDGTPKIADFGLAKHLGRDRSLTESGAIVGTAGYMAPEQARGTSKELPVTPRTDVYGLGATLYELLTGRPPFQGLHPLDTLMQVLSQELVKPRTLQANIPPDLETICEKCLEKEPARRYGSAAELADDLRRYLHGEPIQARPVGPAERLWRWSRRNPLIAGLGAAVATTLLLGATVGIWLAIVANNNADRADRKAAEARESEGKARDEQHKAETELLRSEWLRYGGQITLALRSWEDGDVPAAWLHLEACRKDFRGWEYNYLYHLFNRNQRTFRGHIGQVFCVAFSPDGKRMVSGADDAGIVWDVATGRRLLTLKGPPIEGQLFNAVFRAAFSPDGKWIVTSGFLQGMARLWDATSGQLKWTVRGRGDNVWNVAFLPDGKRLLSATEDGTVQIWEAASGKEIHAFKHREPFTGVALQADGKQLVCGCGQRVKVLDAATGAEAQTLRGHRGNVWSIAVSANGRRIISTDIATVKVWDATTGKEIHNFTGPHSRVMAVAIRPDGQQIAWNGYSTVIRARLTDPERYQAWLPSRLDRDWFESGNFEVAATGFRYRGHREEVTGVAFSPDGTHLASSSRDGTVKLWGLPPQPDTLPLRPHAPVESVAFSPDRRRIVTAGGIGNHQVKIWDVATGEELRTLEGHPDSVRSVAVSLDGKWIASASFDGTVKVWEADSGREHLTVKGRSSRIVAISPDGKRIAFGSSDPRSITVRDMVTGTETLLQGDTGAWSLAFSPDGRQIAAGADRAVKVWDAVTGEELFNLSGHTSLVSALGFRSDGKQIISGDQAGTVILWDAAAGHEVLTCKGHTQAVTSVAFTPDGKRIVSGGQDGTARVWNLTTGHETLSLDGPKLAGVAWNPHLEPIWVAISPDGKRIIAVGTGSQPALTVWDATTPQEP
jgi:WD40 repeat protein/tRNA A-37 threonylcarbamoyl transferase component Bud32